LLAGGVVDETGTLLSLSNGSEVRSVPASERQVRGWSVDLLLVDECALVDDEAAARRRDPTTAARPDARIVLCGSPAGPEGAFYVHAELGDLGSPDVATFHWSFRMRRGSPVRWLMRARGCVAAGGVRREFGGRFADVGAEERVIPPDLVAAAQSRVARG